MFIRPEGVTSLLLSAGLFVLLLWSGCSPAPPEPAEREAGAPSVLVVHLDRFGLTDRDGDGQRNDLNPLDQQQAVAGLIRSVQPDVVLVQDVEPGPGWEALLTALETAGVDYPYRLEPASTGFGPAALSRKPVRRAEPTTDYHFTVQGARLEPVHGIQEFLLQAGEHEIVVLNVQLQDRVFHPLGQSEIRRSEARLLGGRVRALLNNRPDQLLMVAGTLNDRFDSAPLAYLTGTDEAGLADLRPTDGQGHAWTVHDPADETWERVDYLLVSPALRAACLPGRARLLDATDTGSTHRALYAEFLLP